MPKKPMISGVELELRKLMAKDKSKPKEKSEVRTGNYFWAIKSVVQDILTRCPR